MKTYSKKIIIIVIIIGLILAYRLSPLFTYLDINEIFENRENLLNRVNDYFLFSSIIFISAYIITVALSIPGATLLTISGGFFFGPVFGTIYVNIGATTGAVIIFLISRYLLGKNLQEKYKHQLKKLNMELDENGTNYLLTLRFIPLFPFFLINILAGLTNVPAKKFLWTTSLGIIPGSFIYAYIGYAGTTINSSKGLISKEIIIGLVLLGLLSLVPVVIKKIRSIDV